MELRGFVFIEAKDIDRFQVPELLIEEALSGEKMLQLFQKNTK